ncbi:A/G-specific adenine glycosylase [Acidocella aminolytica]|uniref:A/G-specific adenine glycosylase n=1 Tax=Acidocella aminolytica TaxID=33998 RepID=UPI001FD4C470|nr:A/G-specific adenine glycosylase [Acidocella aminolytica]
MTTVSYSSLPPARKLLNWYYRHRRHLPWRAAPGDVADPYRVWLSEIMLQQTVVATVRPYYDKFLAAYPTVTHLAAASVEEVCALWAGLGYYARARNLHKCAQAVVAMGGFPDCIEGLRGLPGIGPYTANAIGAIAFSLPVLPVDGNVERVTARLFAITDPFPGAKKSITKAAERLIEDKDARAAPGDFAQALFDLGATVCTPKSPNCLICPWAAHCQGQADGLADTLPVKVKKAERPRREGVAYVLLDKANNVVLLRRPPHGLLGGMLVLPEVPPIMARWRQAGTVEHVFTHFALTLTVRVARVSALPEGVLSAPVGSAPVPSVMRKALDAACLALNHAGDDKRSA